MLKDNRGFALVIVLLILSVLIAVVSEFVYVVYNETVSLYNWRDLQRLSLEAETGMEVGEIFLNKLKWILDDPKGFTYPERIDLPILDVAGDGQDSMLVSIIDENAKLNMNEIIDDFGKPKDSYDYLKRLLNLLEIDETIADRIADWIDEDREERVSGSEDDAKNEVLYSIDELLNIQEISEDIYKKLLPHVTIFGNGLININSADQYVMMSLSEDASEELAKRVISYRELKPFQKIQDLRNVGGWASIYQAEPLGSNKITVKGSAFTIEVSAFKDRLKRTINAVLSYEGNRFVYKYWKET